MNDLISRVVIDTTFNKKDLAVELQNRLSRWSKTIMQNDLTGILAALEPDKNLLRIDSVEIDLGAIDYGNLEFQLSKKLRKSLPWKLRSITQDTFHLNNQTIINNNIGSNVEMISYFLVNGVLPSGRSEFTLSFNSIVEDQLKTNKQTLISTIREIAGSTPIIVSRLAWQLNENNIKNIIQGLEPAHSVEIISFHNELTHLQNSENFIKSHNGDFGKNTWRWILNYLLNERGNTFNKIAFLQSNLNQMALHYNIDYAELVYYIKTAFETVKQQLSANAPLLKSLSYFVDNSAKKGFRKKGSEKKLLKSQYDTNDPFVLYSKKGGSEWIQHITANTFDGQSPTFAKWFVDRENRTAIISQLPGFTSTSLQSLFAALCIPEEILSQAEARYLAELCCELKIANNSTDVWKVIIKVILGKLEPGLQKKDLIFSLLTELIGKAKKDDLKCIEKLISAESSFALKNNEIHQAWVQEFIQQDLSIKDVKFISARLKSLFKALLDYFVYGYMAKETFEGTLQLIRFYVSANPSVALKVIQGFKGQKGIELIYPYIAEEKYMVSLLRETVDSGYSKLPQIKARLHLLSKDQKKKRLIDHLVHAVDKAILDAIIWGIQIEIADIFFYPVALRNEQLNDSYIQILEDLQKSHLLNPTLSYTLETKKLIAAAGSSSKLSVMQIIQELIEQPGKQAEICEIMVKNFNDRYIKELFVSGNHQGDALLKYFLKNGGYIIAAKVKEGIEFIKAIYPKSDHRNLPQQLQELFWKCIIDYSSYHGDKKLFLNLYNTAFQTRFGINESMAFRHYSMIHTSLNNKTIIISGRKLSKTELFNLIEQGLGSKKKTIRYNGIVYTIDNLVDKVSNIDRKLLLSIFGLFVFTRQRAEILLKKIPADTIHYFAEKGRILPVRNSIREITLSHTSQCENDAHRNTRSKTEFLKNIWQVIRREFSEYKSLKTKKIKLDVGYGHLDLGHSNFVNTKQVIEGYNASIKNKSSTASEKKIPTFPGNIQTENRLYELIKQLITKREVPLWLMDELFIDLDSLLIKVTHDYPLLLASVLANENVPSQHYRWLHDIVGFDRISSVFEQVNLGDASLRVCLKELYNFLRKQNLPKQYRDTCQLNIFRRLITIGHHTGSNAIFLIEVWNELLENAYLAGHSVYKLVLKGISSSSDQLPSELLKCFKEIKLRSSAKTATDRPEVKPFVKPFYQHGQTIAIGNAGLVLASSYLPTYFSRLELTDGLAFKDINSQENAVLLLHYFTSGKTAAEEFLLPLNKIICGVPIDMPIVDKIIITETQRRITDSLIKAMIDHWPVIGYTTENGFRGNWLARRGFLKETDDKWELRVENKPYDLLLNKSSFSFSIIKFPWMPKALHVTWTY